MLALFVFVRTGTRSVDEASSLDHILRSFDV
jgi:hypothetical protein